MTRPTYNSRKNPTTGTQMLMRDKLADMNPTLKDYWPVIMPERRQFM